MSAPSPDACATRPRDGPAEYGWIELTEWGRGMCTRGHLLRSGCYVAVSVNGTAFRACVACHADRRAIYRAAPPSTAAPNPL
jgi:hypothetical protein